VDFKSCSSENQVTDMMLEGESTRKKGRGLIFKNKCLYDLGKKIKRIKKPIFKNLVWS